MKGVSKTDFEESFNNENDNRSSNKQGCLWIAILIVIVLAIIGECNESDNPNKAPDKSSSEVLKSMEETGTLIGVWYDEEMSLKMREKIGRKFVASNGKLYVQACNPYEENMQKGATTALSALATELIINETQYTNADNPNEYYVINKDEDLLIYDEAGLIVKCKRMFFAAGNY